MSRTHTHTLQKKIHNAYISVIIQTVNWFYFEYECTDTSHINATSEQKLNKMEHQKGKKPQPIL